MFYPSPESIDYTQRFLQSLFATTTIEGLVVLLLVILLKLKNVGRLKAWLMGTFVSVLTLPYVWYVFPTLFMWTRNQSLLYSELFIFSVEALLYKLILRVTVFQAILFSLVANIVSYYLPILLRNNGIWFN